MELIDSRDGDVRLSLEDDAPAPLLRVLLERWRDTARRSGRLIVEEEPPDCDDRCRRCRVVPLIGGLDTDAGLELDAGTLGTEELLSPVAVADAVVAEDCDPLCAVDDA